MPPIYDYKCRSCGHAFDDLEEMSAPEIRDCPKCQEPDVAERQVSGGVGLKFNGSGYYLTDYTDRKFS